MNCKLPPIFFISRFKFRIFFKGPTFVPFSHKNHDFFALKALPIFSSRSKIPGMGAELP
jgi:hypothetical protein